MFINFHTKKSTVSPEILILIVSAYIASVSNFTFWRELLTRLDISTVQGIGYVFTSFFIIFFLLSSLFFVFGQRILLKPILVLFVILSATISYFHQELGVLIDKEMVRNIVETVKDRNINEARELLSFPLLLHILALGVAPSIMILLVKIDHGKLFPALMTRSLFALCILMITASTFMMNFKFYTYFYRQNEDLLLYVTPIYPLVAVKKYIKRQIKKSYVFQEMGNDARRVKTNKNRMVGVMVVGETARADHFTYNGYNRQTNPELSRYDNLINFRHVHACGTSTAYSVPCMFSFFDQDNYSPEKALQHSNVLDVLSKTDMRVVWVENNSSCKGVCNRIEEVNLLRHPDKNSEYYNNGQYYDEVMLETFDDVINNTDSDILLVLHTMGSHGPQYHNRYPDSFAVFKPYCRKATPQECSNAEIINAYDNTILYTDYFLSLIINYLKQHVKSYDAFMIYVSDHGESLGEKGVYLHGLPNFVAPEAQTHIPFLMWFSDNFVISNNINLNGLKQLEDRQYTHDNLPHTLLGLLGVQTGLYKRKLDIMYQSQSIGH